jgi:hypothetical protein
MLCSISFNTRFSRCSNFINYLGFNFLISMIRFESQPGKQMIWKSTPHLLDVPRRLIWEIIVLNWFNTKPVIPFCLNILLQIIQSIFPSNYHLFILFTLRRSGSICLAFPWFVEGNIKLRRNVGVKQSMKSRDKILNCI